METLKGQPLTRRENEILTKLGAGLSVKETAFDLGISPKTVEFASKNVRAKLGLVNQCDLVDYCQKNKVVEYRKGDGPQVQALSHSVMKKVSDLEGITERALEAASEGRLNASQCACIVSLGTLWINVQRLKMDARFRVQQER